VPHASGGVTRWNVFETRNGSNQTTRQWVWGSRYVDEVLFMDVNGSVSYNDTCDPDEADGSPTKDRRFFYHQDRNWNVVALSEYADGAGTNARVVERYAYTPYGEFLVLKGDTGSGELGNVRSTSTVGNSLTLGSGGGGQQGYVTCDYKYNCTLLSSTPATCRFALWPKPTWPFCARVCRTTPGTCYYGCQYTGTHIARSFDGRGCPSPGQPGFPGWYTYPAPSPVGCTPACAPAPCAAGYMTWQTITVPRPTSQPGSGTETTGPAPSIES
jgi:hypothetical protein